MTRCATCTSTGLWPIPGPDELRRHYASYYLTRVDDPGRQDQLVEFHKGVFDYLLAHVAGATPHRFLDYGFGGGAFLRYIARQGHCAAGVDVSTQNVRQLSETARRDGISVQLVDLSVGTLNDLGAHRFDVVTLFQVIEHVPDPSGLITRLARLQDPGALLYLECPNDGAAWARFKNPLHLARGTSAWSSLKYPEHLHGFTPFSIGVLLRASGYEVVDCGDYAYRDGVHQVESEYWWPRFSSKPRSRTTVGLVRSLIPLFDRVMSTCFSSGSGLFALARKRVPAGSGPSGSTANRVTALR